MNGGIDTSVSMDGESGSEVPVHDEQDRIGTVMFPCWRATTIWG